jgi:hypothetical protein
MVKQVRKPGVLIDGASPAYGRLGRSLRDCP